MRCLLMRFSAMRRNDEIDEVDRLLCRRNMAETLDCTFNAVVENLSARERCGWRQEVHRKYLARVGEYDEPCPEFHVSDEVCEKALAGSARRLIRGPRTARTTAVNDLAAGRMLWRPGRIPHAVFSACQEFAWHQSATPPGPEALVDLEAPRIHWHRRTCSGSLLYQT